MINIVYITDSQYVLPTRISIFSLVKNVDIHKEYSVYILGVGLSDEDKTDIKKSQTENVKINIVDVQNDYSDSDTEHLYVSKAALLKFSLADAFPDLDKILYIDGDTLIQSDLENLYNHNIISYYVAAVSDISTVVERKQNKRLQYDNYFNSGVMLINLCKWREDDIYRKLLINKKNDKCSDFMDQDALNAVLGNHVLYLELKYNCIYENIKKYSYEQISENYNISLAEVEEAVKHPVILHLAGFIKPWKIPIVDKYEVWANYLDIDSLKVCIPNYYQSVMDEIQGLEDKIKHIKDEVRQVKDEVRQVKDEIKQVKDEVRQVKDEVRQVKDEVRQVEDEIKQTNDDVRRIETNMDRRLDDLDRQLQYVRSHTFWGACCHIYDKIRRVR